MTYSPENTEGTGKHRNKILLSLLFPVLFVSLLWLLELLQVSRGFRLWNFGIIPRTAEGLTGIITAPFIHSGYDHLISNTLPLLIVGTGLFYFYPTLALRVVAIVWTFSGIWVWLAGRDSSHIGASGLVYGFVTFLFLSGLIRKDNRLIAISLLVTFLYGSLVWGILPVDQTVSWESHLFGAIAGILSAIYYRKDGPQREKAQWEIDEENERNASEETMTENFFPPSEQENFPQDPDSVPFRIRYHFRQNTDEDQSEKGF